MSATSFLPWRRAWIRYAFTIALLLLAAVTGGDVACNDDWGAIVLLPFLGAQMLGFVFSLVMALVAWLRFDYRGALAELGVAVLLLLSNPAALAVMHAFMKESCE